jgi:hypothetical protein
VRRAFDLYSEKERLKIMYYRIAMQAGDESCWKWYSTPLESLGALFQLLRVYSAIPQDRLRVFTASSRQEMNEMLARENNGHETTSVTAGQFLSQRRISSFGSKQESAGAGNQEQRRKASTITLPPLAAQSTPAEASFQQQGLSAVERRRWELEMGEGGDHDQPYTFALPLSMPQLLAWTRLLVRIQNGELLS